MEDVRSKSKNQGHDYQRDTQSLNFVEGPVHILPKYTAETCILRDRGALQRLYLDNSAWHLT